jgi:uncharacterized protein YdeI (YjbR/CyaY-like superfamily)
MKITNTLYAKSCAEWRHWLENNHQNLNEVWLIFYKEHTGKPSISYDDALDEALCYGWIDSIIQKIDEEKYARKFTVRRNIRKWSDSNKRRVERLIKESRMTQLGLEKIDDLKSFDQGPFVNKKPTLQIPPEIENEIKVNLKAWKNYQNLTASKRRNYLGWVMNAKKEETFKRRLKEVISVLEQNKPLELK